MPRSGVLFYLPCGDSVLRLRFRPLCLLLAGCRSSGLRGDDQPAALPVLALPDVLDLGEWNQLAVYLELDTGGPGHACWNASTRISPGGMTAVPRPIAFSLRRW